MSNLRFAVITIALFAGAFNLLLGYAGLMSFGHAMFFGMAGYLFGHVVKVWAMPPEVGILAGVSGAALLGLVTGALAIRRQGIYFAMITLALAQMMYFFALQAKFTGGEDGIQGVPRGQMEAALALGMTRLLALRRIVIPQAVRLVIPPVTNDFIALFKAPGLNPCLLFLWTYFMKPSSLYPLRAAITFLSVLSSTIIISYLSFG